MMIPEDAAHGVPNADDSHHACRYDGADFGGNTLFVQCLFASSPRALS